MKYKTWSESAGLQGFEPDGRTGFIARVQRFPGSGHDWLWLLLFTPKRVYGFIEEHLPAGRDVTRVDTDDVGYRVGNQQSPGGGVLQRRGPRTEPGATVAFAYGKGHTGPRLREGVGEEEISASGVLTPAGPAEVWDDDRSDVIGAVSGKLGFRQKNVDLEGYGHWYEQHQFTPRFTTPFTYFSLIGAESALVALRTPDEVRGFIRRGAEVERLSGLEVSPVAESRRLRLTTGEGLEIELQTHDVHRYTMPIQRRRRPCSVATVDLEGRRLVGIIDDWMEDEFPAELDAP